MLDLLKPVDTQSHQIGVSACSKALIYVWALEQKHSRRGWDAGDDQDVMVPWVMKQRGTGDNDQAKTFNRYYHLYRRGEVERDIQAAGGEVLESGYEKDNWWAIAIKTSVDHVT